MNKILLCGRATRDAEVRGEGDKKVARYTLAVDRKYSKEEKQADFINIVCFGKSAEFAGNYVKKGTKMIVTGRIQTGSYTNKDGQKVNTTDVIVEEQEFAESKSASNAGFDELNNTSAPKSSDNDFMDIPADALNDMPF